MKKKKKPLPAETCPYCGVLVFSVSLHLFHCKKMVAGVEPGTEDEAAKRDRETQDLLAAELSKK